MTPGGKSPRNMHPGQSSKKHSDLAPVTCFHLEKSSTPGANIVIVPVSPLPHRFRWQVPFGIQCRSLAPSIPHSFRVATAARAVAMAMAGPGARATSAATGQQRRHRPVQSSPIRAMPAPAPPPPGLQVQVQVGAGIMEWTSRQPGTASQQATGRGLFKRYAGWTTTGVVHWQAEPAGAGAGAASKCTARTTMRAGAAVAAAAAATATATATGTA